MKTLLALTATLATAQLAYGFINYKKAKKIEVKETHIKQLHVTHNNKSYTIELFHTNVLCHTTMPNAIASSQIEPFTNRKTHKIVVHESLVNTAMYDAVLAHETGHIVLGHTITNFFETITVKRIFEREFEADAYAVAQGHLEGMIKFRMNALKFMGFLPDYNQSC